MFWTHQGEIRKIVDQLGPSDASGTTRTRFYSECQLILTRTAPNNLNAVKDPIHIEKYYFRKRKLLAVKHGDQKVDLPEEEFTYYQRSMYAEAPRCKQEP